MIRDRGGQMKTITKIVQQKKNKSRYSIYLNDEYAFGVEEELIISHHLHKGKELSEKELEQLLDAEVLQKAYSSALNYISYRMRSIAEVEAYLQKEEVESIIAQKVIVRLIREKYLDDQAYAHAFVADRILLTSKGPTVIQRELIQKGVDEQIAIVAVSEYSKEAQFEKAEKWAQKEWKKRSKHPARKRKEQIYVKLMQKGFTKDIIPDVIATLDVEDSTETDEEILLKQIDKIKRRYEKKYEGYDLKMRIKAALFQRGFSVDTIDEYMDKLDESL